MATEGLEFNAITIVLDGWLSIREIESNGQTRLHKKTTERSI